MVHNFKYLKPTIHSDTYIKQYITGKEKMPEHFKVHGYFAANKLEFQTLGIQNTYMYF